MFKVSDTSQVFAIIIPLVPSSVHYKYYSFLCMPRYEKSWEVLHMNQTAHTSICIMSESSSMTSHLAW